MDVGLCVRVLTYLFFQQILIEHLHYARDWVSTAYGQGRGQLHTQYMIRYGNRGNSTQGQEWGPMKACGGEGMVREP